MNESDADFEPDNSVSADVLANKPDKREESIVDQNTPSDESEDEMDDQSLSSLNIEPMWQKSELNIIGNTIFKKLPPQPAPDETVTPYQYFKMFVTDQLLDMVAEQSNLYSVQSSGSSINITAKGIEKFHGIYFQMGLVKLPSTRLYRETHMSYNEVSSILSKNHFSAILHNLHSVRKDADCAWKIRPWLSGLGENFSKGVTRRVSIHG